VPLKVHIVSSSTPSSAFQHEWHQERFGSLSVGSGPFGSAFLHEFF
jgi:hypothetical protein